MDMLEKTDITSLNL